MSDVRKALDKLRDLGWTSAAIADELRVSPVTVFRWQKRQPTGPLEIGAAPFGDPLHQEKDSQTEEKGWVCHLPQFEQHFTTETGLTGSHNIPRGMSL